MAKIKEVTAREILNAKGLPTIEATVILSDGKVGVASCPTGDVISNYEALAIKDPITAINNINKAIAPILLNKEALHQQEIDKAMIDLDGTQNKARIGANAMLSVSMAVAKAAAESSVLPLFLYLRQFVKKGNDLLKIPTPIFNLIKGRANSEAGDFSEYLVVPASSKPYIECIQMGENIYKSLRQFLQTKNSKEVGEYDESFSPNISNSEAFSFIQKAAEDAKLRIGFDAFLGIDSRASLFFKDGKYKIMDSPTPLSSKDMVSYYEELNKNIHLLYLEDPLDQDDWEGWTLLFEKLSKTTIIAGGDLTGTNPYRLQMALDKKAINGIVIKPSQVGTVIESLAIAQGAFETGIKIIVSHRSNETNDDFLSDFAVAVSADYIKIGSLSRGENIAKYNRLLQIENQLKIL